MLQWTDNSPKALKDWDEVIYLRCSTPGNKSYANSCSCCPTPLFPPLWKSGINKTQASEAKLDVLFFLEFSVQACLITLEQIQQKLGVLSHESKQWKLHWNSLSAIAPEAPVKEKKILRKFQTTKDTSADTQYL